jgi:hypothetical protein
MRNTSLRIHQSALGGYTIDGPYKRNTVRRTVRARFALLLAMLVAGCEKTQAEAPTLFSTEIKGPYELVAVDHETGCQYIETGNSGLYPRLNSHGKPMCGKGGE